MKAWQKQTQSSYLVHPVKTQPKATCSQVRPCLRWFLKRGGAAPEPPAASFRSTSDAWQNLSRTWQQPNVLMSRSYQSKSKWWRVLSKRAVPTGLRCYATLANALDAGGTSREIFLPSDWQILNAATSAEKEETRSEGRV